MNTRKAIAAAIAVAAIGGFAACSSDPAKKETVGEYAGDAGLTAKVKTAIATDVGVKAASAVNVETYRGVVQLSGFADSDDQASRAASAAKKVNGVRSVKNDMRIKAGS